MGKSIGDILAATYEVSMYLFALKAMLQLPYLLSYEKHFKLYKDAMSSYNRSGIENATRYQEICDLKRLAKEEYDDLIKYSLITRDSGSDSTIFCHFCFVLWPATYRLCRWMYRDELKCSQGVLSFMADFRQEMLELNGRINKCIDRTKYSIEMNKKIVMAGNGYKFSDASKSPNSQVLIKQSTFLARNIGRCNNYAAGRINQVKMELDYLNELRNTWKKLLIWPQNRNSKQLKINLRVWTFVYISSMIFYWIVGTICENMIVYLLVKAMKTVELLDESQRGFTIPDYLGLLFSRLFLIHTNEYCSEPAAFLCTSFLDMLTFLTSIMSRLHQLTEELRSQSCVEFVTSDRYHLKRQGAIRENYNQNKNLDLKLMELLVSYQVFSLEIRCMFRRAEHSIVYTYISLLEVIMIAFAWAYSIQI